MPQAQAVAQVQTGLQLQSWQLQEELDETVDFVGFVFFIGDLVSSLSTEALAPILQIREFFWNRPAALRRN